MLEEKVEVWEKAVDRCEPFYKGTLKVSAGPTPGLHLETSGSMFEIIYYPHNLPYMWYLVGVNGVEGPLLKCWNLMQNAHTMLSTAIRVEEAHSVSTKNKIPCKESI